jgi:hypothetical protein
MSKLKPCSFSCGITGSPAILSGVPENGFCLGSSWSILFGVFGAVHRGSCKTYLQAGCHDHRLCFPLLTPPRLQPSLDKPFLGPSISKMSFLLNFKVPPKNLPTAGAPTPLSLLPPELFFSILAFSKIIPLSLASRRLFASLSLCLAIIPFRCAMGIFSCFNIEVLDPNAWSRRSVALCLLFPLRVGLDAESRRWDSVRRR